MFLSPNTGGYAYFLYATSARLGKNGLTINSGLTMKNSFPPLASDSTRHRSKTCAHPTETEVIARTESFLQKVTKATKGRRSVGGHGPSGFGSSFIVALVGVQRNSVCPTGTDAIGRTEIFFFRRQ